jgi:hypothetical protein
MFTHTTQNSNKKITAGLSPQPMCYPKVVRWRKAPELRSSFLLPTPRILGDGVPHTQCDKRREQNDHEPRVNVDTYVHLLNAFRTSCLRFLNFFRSLILYPPTRSSVTMCSGIPSVTTIPFWFSATRMISFFSLIVQYAV